MRRRKRHISVWMNDKEYAKFKKKAMAAGLGIDPFIRNLVAGVEIKPKPPEEYSKLLQELSAIGNNINQMLHVYNELRLGMDEDSPYINSGVMLLNLKKLREEQDYQEVLDFIEKKKRVLSLPDQDIISTLYGSKIYPLDFFRYNMTELLYKLHHPQEKSLTLDWIREHSVIVHYCGRNKPWKPKYIGHPAN